MQSLVFLRPITTSVTWSIEQLGRSGTLLNPEHRLRCSEAASPVRRSNTVSYREESVVPRPVSLHPLRSVCCNRGWERGSESVESKKQHGSQLNVIKVFLQVYVTCAFPKSSCGDYFTKGNGLSDEEGEKCCAKTPGYCPAGLTQTRENRLGSPAGDPGECCATASVGFAECLPGLEGWA